MKTALCFLSASLLASCASRAPRSLPSVEPTSSSCQITWMSLDEKPMPARLRGLNALFRQECDAEVIALGRLILSTSRDKVYSISQETSEFFLSDGVSTDYVLEGYERVYLSLLMGMSALRRGDVSSAEIFFRKAGEDHRAWITNPTDDPVLIALQAALWENAGNASNARPYWKQLHEKKTVSKGLRRFATAQMERIDRTRRPASWRIFSSTQELPRPRWKSTRFSFQGQIYDFQPDREFVPACEAPEGTSALVSTRSWFEELRGRHSVDRRPLTMAKGMTRGALGLTFAATAATAGLGVAVLGCGSNAGQAACEASIYLGAFLATLGYSLTESYLEPDVRHWENLPGGFYLVRADAPARDGSCSSSPIALESRPLYIPALTLPSSASTKEP